MCFTIIWCRSHAEIRERTGKPDEVRRRAGAKECRINIDCKALKEEARPCRRNFDRSLVRLLCIDDIGITENSTGAPIYFDCCVPTSDLRKEICLAWIEVIIMNKNKSELGQDLPLEE